MARPKGTADGVNVIHHPAMGRSLKRAADRGAVVLVTIVVRERRPRTRAEQDDRAGRSPHHRWLGDRVAHGHGDLPATPGG